MALKYNPVTGKVEDDGLGVQTRQIPSAITSAVLGATGAPVSAAFDATRTGLTNLFGGDPSTLPGGPSKFSDESQAARDVGLGNLGMAADNYGQAFSRLGLGLLGAQPAAAPQPEDPIVPPLPTPPADAVLTQPPAPQVVQAPVPIAQAAPVPRAMEPVPTEVQSVQQLDVRPPPQNSGLTFGFGGGNETARQYLDRMAVVDQQRAQSKQLQQTNNKIGWATQELGRDNATVGERLAARQQLAALQPLALGLTQAAGNQTTQQLGDNAALQRTQLEADANASAAALQAQTQLGVAGLGAEATLGAAGLRANATQQAKLLELQLEQVSPKSQLATTRNRIESARLRMAEAAEAAGDTAGAARILSGGAAAGEKPVLDMFQNLIGFRDEAGNVRRLDDDKIMELRTASRLQQGLQ